MRTASVRDPRKRDSAGKLFITTKVWNTAQRVGDIEGAFNRSLDRLRLDYVDLYLIHWPVPGCYPETWRALEKIRESGRAKSIGVSNFEEPHLTALFEFSGVIPVVNQIECHPLWNRKPLIAFCRSHGIAVQAYAPLARGLYLNREIMQQLAEKYVRTEAQIGLRYLVQQGISVIPKSTHPDRIFTNADVFDFELSEADMALIDTMDEQPALLPYRMTCCNCGFTEKAAQKICFFPFQISVLLFLFLFISRIPSSLLQVQIQSPIASASSKSCVTRSIVFLFLFCGYSSSFSFSSPHPVPGTAHPKEEICVHAHTRRTATRWRMPPDSSDTAWFSQPESTEFLHLLQKMAEASFFSKHAAPYRELDIGCSCQFFCQPRFLKNHTFS